MVPEVTIEGLAPGARVFRFNQPISDYPDEFFSLPLLPTRTKVRVKLDRAGPLAELILKNLDRHWATAYQVRIKSHELLVLLGEKFDFEREADELFADILEVILLCFQEDEQWLEYWSRKAGEALEQGLGCGVCVVGRYQRYLDSDRSWRCSNCFDDLDPDFYWERLKKQRREKGLPSRADDGW